MRGKPWEDNSGSMTPEDLVNVYRALPKVARSIKDLRILPFDKSLRESVKEEDKR